MSDTELADYMIKSRQRRRKMVEKAQDYIKAGTKTNTLVVPLARPLEFPTPSPKRLIEFREQVGTKLQQIFTPSTKKEAHLPVLKSIPKEEDFKEIYIGKSRMPKNHKRHKSDTPTYSPSSIFTKHQYKQLYLIPLLSKYNKS
jgi:hypothetical protein